MRITENLELPKVSMASALIDQPLRSRLVDVRCAGVASIVDHRRRRLQPAQLRLVLRW